MNLGPNPTVDNPAPTSEEAANIRAALGLTTASQAEMEAGTEAALRSMSPLRVAQAIAALTTEPTALTRTAAEGSPNGASASNTLSAGGLPTGTVTIGDVTYTFVVSTANPYELYADDAAGAIAVLIAAINGNPHPDVGAGTLPHPIVTAEAGIGDTLIVKSSPGTGGDYNGVVTTAEGTGLTWNLSALLGGINGAGGTFAGQKCIVGDSAKNKVTYEWDGEIWRVSAPSNVSEDPNNPGQYLELFVNADLALDFRTYSLA